CPDVVHTHQVGALFYAGAAARTEGVRAIVHTEHGKHYATRRRTRWLGWWAGRYAARFCCVSEDIAAEVKAYRIVPAGKVHVVTNGIDTGRFREVTGAPVRHALGIPQGAPVVGTIGRLAEVKRQDLLLRAFARVRHRFAGAHLLLVGDGPLIEYLRRLAVDLGLPGVVHFVGYQADPAPYLAAMDVFALTSRSEGMPLAILEAWAARVPVIASAVGGLPALIDSGRTGLLFPPGDEIALAEALAGLLADAHARSRLGEKGSDEVVARYDTSRMAGDYERHYRQLLA